MLCFYWTALPWSFPAAPQLPAQPWSQMGPGLPQPHSTRLLLLPRTPLPIGVTNLLPFRFCHPELVVAQQEGPHGLADLRLDAPVVDEAQQLLLLIALWGGEEGEQRVRSTEIQGQPRAQQLCSPGLPLEILA